MEHAFHYKRLATCHLTEFCDPLALYALFSSLLWEQEYHQCGGSSSGKFVCHSLEKGTDALYLISIN